MLETAAIDTDKFVLLPPKTWWQEQSLSERFGRAISAARRLGLNRIEYPSSSRKALGFVSSGLAYGYLRQGLWELGLLGEFPIAKFGMSYPMDAEMVRELASQCERIIVVEERRGFLEEQIGQVILTGRQRGLPCGEVELWGKEMPFGLEGFPSTRGLHPSIVISRLVPLLKSIGTVSKIAVPVDLAALDREMRTIDSTAEADVAPLPVRFATFCPGCPHRDSADLCLEIKKRFMEPAYMRRHHGREPVDLMFHGDTGCYTMLMFPPNTALMHDYSGMGLGGGTGSGTDPFITNKQLVFMGDSTFFHSGQLAISQAIKLCQDITFIILDNSTTAMTGHQPTPGVDWDIVGQQTPTQGIEDIVTGIAGEGEVPVIRVNPEDRKSYRRLLERTILADGVKVMIAEKECGIMRLRRKRRTDRDIIRTYGHLPTAEHMNINTEICRFCLTCAEMTGCPGLKHVETDYGRKMDTDLTNCVNDGACERIGACWSFERVTIKRSCPPRNRVPELGLDDIPEPRQRPAGDMWHCYLAGVGGMGIGLATQILVRAGHKEGFHVVFVDKKGLAIRNGGVNSQVAFMKTPQPSTGMIPYGKADLIIGVDILEAARAMDPTGRMRVASAERTAAVINTDKILTISTIMGREDFNPDQLERTIRAHTREDDFLARNISRICEKYLDSKIYANIMMLGFAFQKGLIPVSMHSIAWAIKDTIRADFKKNLYAFNMGRKLLEEPGLFQGPPQRKGWVETLQQRCRDTVRRYWRGQAKAEALRELATRTVEALSELDESIKRDVVVRLYDCMRWGGQAYARRYGEQIIHVYRQDRAEFGYAATLAAIHNLAGAMLIKDAVFIAELATSPEKYARDREKYNVNPAKGDRISYRHLLPITLKIGSRELHFDLAAPDWALKLLKRMKWLRVVLPMWHRNERKYLAQYEASLAEFAPTDDRLYHLGLTMLSEVRCIACTNPTCQEIGCPVDSKIPEWIELAYRGDWRGASDRLHERNNFPEFTASICPAPCQQACKSAIGGYSVQIRQTERQIVEKAFAEGWISPLPTAKSTGKRVAIVGSGPAGLTTAQQLARAGHAVVVFEKDELPGGLLRWGIPEFRLEKGSIDRRCRQLVEEGVEFRNAVEVGKDVLAADLMREFDAVCLATGAPRPRNLNVAGRESGGIHYALDFLRRHNDLAAGRGTVADPALAAADKTVVVIGGGETGNDCVEVALAQGAKEVHQLEILPRWLVSEDQTHTRSKNVRRQWTVTTKQFVGNSSGLCGLTAAKVRWVHSANGPKMIEVPGAEFSFQADMALLALGYDAAVDRQFAEQFGLQTDSRDKLVLKHFATSVPGIFAAGDLATGSALVVNAIASGRKAAEKIDEYLRQHNA
ncbi:MAG: FAD-dependent oxidoreductase, partial [Planctomycetes bacterium]|nr:FAD-dependent oxidoreductase [Planctomycetota bacterium]